MNMQTGKAPAKRKQRTSEGGSGHALVAAAKHAAGSAATAKAAVDARASERQTMTACAAYYRAQKRGFEPGHELDDWFAAEAEVTELLSASKRAPVQAG